MSAVFGNYARYYDLLYRDKDYAGEVQYVESLIKRYATLETHSILDVGCGTGVHAARFAEKGYTVYGVDRSDDMIKAAQARKSVRTKFVVGDAFDFSLDTQVDVVVSLFHVMNYHTTNEGLSAVIANVARHLRPGGLFIFDTWYGPAVLTDRPVVRVKRLEDEAISVRRIAEPVWRANENVIEVHYELLIEDKAHHGVETLRETHNMRFLFKPEIELLLNAGKMRAIRFEEWMTGKEPSEQTWGVCCVVVRE